MASQSEPNGSFIHRIGLDLYNLLESLGLILEQKKSAITEFFSSCAGNINNLAGRGYNLTISAFASVVRKPSPSQPVPVTHENGIYTLVFSQGCGPFSRDCILKEFDTVEELQEITAIAAGPRPFGSTSVNTTVWRTPIQYYFNPSYDYNYHSTFEHFSDVGLGPDTNHSHLLTDSIYRNLALPSNEKALAIVERPEQVKANMTPALNSSLSHVVGAGACLLILSALIGAGLVYAFQYAFPSKKKYTDAELEELVAATRVEAEGTAEQRIQDVMQQKEQDRQQSQQQIQILNEDLDETRIKLQNSQDTVRGLNGSLDEKATLLRTSQQEACSLSGVFKHQTVNSC